MKPKEDSVKHNINNYQLIQEKKPVKVMTSISLAVNDKTMYLADYKKIIIII